MGFALTSVLPAWLSRRTVGGAAEQPSCWQAFRKAALGTPYYKNNPIARASVIELADFYARHAEFLNPAALIPPPVTLSGIWDPLPKTYAINPWFRLAEPVETVVASPPLPGKDCEVLAAPVGVLASLLAREPSLPAPEFGVIAFTGISQPPLTPVVRDAVWRLWRVPVVEQFRGFQGELLASECEAFAGLHFDPQVAVWEERSRENPELLATSLANLRHPAWRLATGRRGRVEHAACECGSTLPRIFWEP